jgi:hypothetical protein
MNRGESNQATHAENKIPCLICGTRIAPNGSRSIDLVCLICRAAILDRIFRARRRHAGFI